MAVTKTINLEVNTKDAKKSLKGLEKGVDDVNKEVKETSKSTQQMSGTLDKVTGGAVSKFGAFKGALTSVTTGFKSLKVAIIATGIGALLIAVTSLIAAFKRSEAGQEKFQIALAAIGAVTNQVMDAFASLGELIIDVFTKPQEVFKSFADGFMKFISDPIGTVKGAFNDAKEAVTDFIEETKTEISAMTEITKARQKAHHIDRALKTERAEADRKINDIRLQAEDRENNNATQRIALLKEAQRLEEEITQKEIVSQRIKIKAQADEMALGKTTIEDKDKLAEMQAKLIQLDTKKLRSQRLLQTQITTATNEEKAEKQRKIDEAAAELEKEAEAELARLERIKQIQDEFEQQQLEENAIKEEEKAEIQKTKELAELESLNATEEEKAKIIAYWNGQIQKGKDADIKADAERDKIEKDAKLAMAKSTFLGIAQLLGENSKAGKAAAAAAALINTYQGITAELATKTVTPFEIGLKIANVATIAGIGFKSVKDILKTNPKSTSGATAISPTRTASVATPNVSSIVAQTPSFNILGTSGTNQIASALGEQPPVQAFVVSQDVTTSQSLQNNIIQSASLG